MFREKEADVSKKRLVADWQALMRTFLCPEPVGWIRRRAEGPPVCDHEPHDDPRDFKGHTG